MKHLDIKEDQYYQQKSAKNYFWPVAFGFPMTDPFFTGPISQPVLSPAGGIVAPRRNPYVIRPTNPITSPYASQMRPRCYHQNNPYRVRPSNPFTNPYITQMRQTMGPMYMTLPPASGGFPRPPRRPRPMNPYGPRATNPYAPIYRGPMMMPPAPSGVPPMGVPPMGPPMGPGSMGPPTMGPMFY